MATATEVADPRLRPMTGAEVVPHDPSDMDDGVRAAGGVYLWSLACEAGGVTISNGENSRSLLLEDWLLEITSSDRDRVRALVAWAQTHPGKETSEVFAPTSALDGPLVLRCRGLVDSCGTTALVYGILGQAGPVRRDAALHRQLMDVQQRVRGVLATIRSLAHRTLENSETLEDFGAHFDGRIAALSNVQAALGSRLDGLIDVEALVRQELLQTALANDAVIEIGGPPAPLSIRATELLALTIHELCMNALKFGALAEDTGALSVQWSLTPEDPPEHFIFDWRETGVIIGNQPTQRGFGSHLIENGLPYAISATSSLQLLPDGLSCRIRIPLLPSPAPMLAQAHPFTEP